VTAQFLHVPLHKLSEIPKAAAEDSEWQEELLSDPQDPEDDDDNDGVDVDGNVDDNNDNYSLDIMEADDNESLVHPVRS
jgi:hypothetical protein